MKADRVLLIPLAIAIAVITAPVNAGQNEPEAAAVEKLPAAREVVDRYVAALGGEDAILEKSSLRITGKGEIPSLGFRGEFEFLLKAPNKSSVEIRLDNGMSVSEGFDGETAWQVDPMLGPRIVEDSGLIALMKLGADFYRALHRPADVRSMETVARTDFEGSTCYELVVTSADGLVFQEYFDVDSGLLLGFQLEVVASGMKVPVIHAMSDYRDFDGVKLPTRLRMRQGPMEVLQLMTDARWGGVEESEVAPPDAIKALLEQETADP